MHIRRIKIGCALICVKRVSGLIVAGLVQSSKIIPDLGYIRIKANGPGVRIKRVPILVDLVIEYANGAPESRVSAVTIDSLLIGLVRLGILLL